MDSFSYHGLNEIRNKMNKMQKEKLVDYFKNDVLSFGFKVSNDKNNLKIVNAENKLDKINCKNTTRGHFLWILLMAFNYKKEYSFCEWLIEYVEENNLLVTATDKHFFYSECIKVFYKPKSPEIYNEEKAEMYCVKSIKNFEQYKNEYVINRKKESIKFIDLYTGEERKKRLEEIENITFSGGTKAYLTLAKIYEKQGKYVEALQVCYEAMSDGDDDNTKGGYFGRINRIKRKMNK